MKSEMSLKVMVLAFTLSEREHIERFRIVECLDLTHVLKARTLLPCEKQIIEGYTLIISKFPPSFYSHQRCFC